MPVTWITTQYPGVRYYEHASRKGRNGQPDKYFTLRYRVNGERKEEGLGWASEGWSAEKAYKVLSDIKAGVRTGDGPQSLAEKRAVAKAEREAVAEAKLAEERAGMTLAEFFHEHYMPRAKREKRSWKTDEQRFAKAIGPALGALPLCAIRPADVQRLLDALTDSGAAPATVKQYMSIVRRAFNIALQTTINDVPIFEGHNPATGLRLAPVHNARVRYFTAHEIELLLEAASKLRFPDLRDAIIISLNTGLRLGEIMRMQWTHVDMTGGMLQVPQQNKRKTGGIVPINEAAAAVLQRRRGESEGGGKVFPPLTGADERTNLSHAFGGIVDSIGLNDGITDPLNKVVFHTLRHTFASWLALAGVDIYRIKTLMRHKDIRMTMRYAHLIPDATRDAVLNLRPPSMPEYGSGKTEKN